MTNSCLAKSCMPALTYVSLRPYTALTSMADLRRKRCHLRVCRWAAKSRESIDTALILTLGPWDTLDQNLHPLSELSDSSWIEKLRPALLPENETSTLISQVSPLPKKTGPQLNGMSNQHNSRQYSYALFSLITIQLLQSLSQLMQAMPLYHSDAIVKCPQKSSLSISTRHILMYPPRTFRP